MSSGGFVMVSNDWLLHSCMCSRTLDHLLPPAGVGICSSAREFLVFEKSGRRKGLSCL